MRTPAERLNGCWFIGLCCALWLGGNAPHVLAEATTIGVRTGSAGWGVELKTQIAEPAHLRFIWQRLETGAFDVNTNIVNPLQYRSTGHFNTTGLVLDWHPWATPFRFSFGALKNLSQFEVRDTQTQTVYRTNFGNLAYFFGSGWSPQATESAFHITLDIGMIAQQTPNVRWQPDNISRTDPDQEQIWQERQNLIRAIDQYKILPVFMIGLNYRL